MLILICLIVTAQAYLFNSIVPDYNMISSTAGIMIPEIARGYLYLSILIGLLTVFFVSVIILLKKKSVTGEMMTE